MKTNQNPLPTQIQEFKNLCKSGFLLLYLLILGKPMRLKRLAELAGVTTATAHRHLANLEQEGWIVRDGNRGIYHLTDQFFAVIAPGIGNFISGDPLVFINIINHLTLEELIIITEAVNDQILSVHEKISADSAYGRTSVRLPVDKPVDNLWITRGQEDEEKKAVVPKESSWEDSDLREVWAALGEAFIYPNKRTMALAKRPFINPDYIRAHRLQLEANGKKNDPGLLITILESGIPAPELNNNGHLKGCTCERCNYGRSYTGGLICAKCREYPCSCGEEVDDEDEDYEEYEEDEEDYEEIG